MRHLYSCAAPTGLVDFPLHDPDLTVWAYEYRRSAATLVAEGKKTARFLDSWPRDPKRIAKSNGGQSLEMTES